MNFAITGELESNFLTTPTEKPKLNHGVNKLNELVIRFESYSRFILKGYFYITFVSQNL